MFLLKKYQAHINVEWCNKTTFIKYLFKYVTKGADCSKVYLERVKNAEDALYDAETRTVNEVKEYLDCRYICEQDACWRILGFDIHRHFPVVERMPVHLPNENFITSRSKAKMDKVLSAEFLRRTMLTQWFVVNQMYPHARDLTYIEFPSKWRWESDSRSWIERRQDQGKIGRLHYVHPSAGERYYLRLLLLAVKGARGFAELRYHNGIQHATYKEACASRGLVGDDREWHAAFTEATAWASAAQLRRLFVTMIIFCDIADERAFFNETWTHLAEDIEYKYRNIIGDRDYQMPDSMKREYLLDELASLFTKSGSNISQFNLPRPSQHAMFLSTNRLVDEELSYNSSDIFDDSCLMSTLNAEQLHAFHSITTKVANSEPGFFFVSGYGGTGKTYLWRCIVAHLRAQKKLCSLLLHQE